MSAARFDYFFTYARDDKDAARELEDRLAAFGIRFASDFGEGGLREGESWLAQLEDLLSLSDSYLILAGHREINRWVKAELEVALDRNANDPGFRIVPVLLPGVSPASLPPFLGRFEVVQLAEDWRLPGSISLARLIRKLRPPREGAAAKSPFPGLRAFDTAMSAYFFGRSGELQQILRLLGSTPSGHRRWLQIEGASGSGKSSLAQAGLLPAVEAGLLEGAPSSFETLVFRPGQLPLRSLAQALLRRFEGGRPGFDLRAAEEALAKDAGGLLYLLRENLPAGQGFLLLVDQLEELFSLSAGDSGPVRQLGALLAAALDDGDFPFYLATTIRSDFLGELAKSPELIRHLNGGASRYLLPEIGAAGLAEAVRQPVLVAGLGWENESLPERIVRDAGLSPGSLPLVAHVLAEMWARDARGGVLRHETYDRLGGVGGALARSADQLLESFGERERAAAKKLLLALLQVQPGAGESRRVLGRDELLQAVGGGVAAEEVLARLSGGRDPRAPEGAPPPPRLVSVRADQNVELVHEALLRNWKTLRAWIEENRKKLECRNDVENAARSWAAAGRPEEGVPRGKQLAYFRQAELVGGLGRELLAAGEALEERGQRLRREETRFRRLLGRAVAATAVAILLLIALNYQPIYVWAIEKIYLDGLSIAVQPSPRQIEFVEKAEKKLVFLGTPDTDAHRRILARLEIVRGLAQLEQDQTEAALARFDRAFELAEAIDAEDIERPALLVHAAAGRAKVQIRRQQLAIATASVERVAEIVAALPIERGRLMLLGPEIQLRALLAGGLASGGETKEALAQLEKTVPLRQRLEEDPVWRDLARGFLGTLAYGYDSVGRQANLRGDAETAFAAHERAAELHRTAGPTRATLAFARLHAPFLANLATVARQRNDWRRARKALSGIPEIFAGTDFLAYPSDRRNVVDAYLNLSEVDFLDNRRDLSRQSLSHAGAILDHLAALPVSALAPGELQSGRMQLEWRLSALAEAEGRASEAASHLESSCRLGGELVGLDPASTIFRYQQLTCLDRLARLTNSHGWNDKLAATLGQAKEAYREYPSPASLENDPQVRFLLSRLRPDR